MSRAELIAKICFDLDRAGFLLVRGDTLANTQERIREAREVVKKVLEIADKEPR